MSYIDTPHFHAGRASDLTGTDRYIYRALEIFPGLLSWTTLIGVILLSAYKPVFAALFIIVFDVYWVLKTIFLSIHLRQNWKRMKHNMAVDWDARLENLKHDHLYHLVLLPFYNESRETLEASVEAMASAKGDKSRMVLVLAAEERGGKEAQNTARAIQEQYKDVFGHFIITVHPTDVPGEMPGKGSNIAYAAEEARRRILEPNNIAYTDVVVSAFDIDTVVYPQYFTCLAWHFLTAENPHRSSFQPVPVYNNNIWEAPALARVVAVSGTFWQMIQQERPERLATFSSHAVSFQALHEIGYWQRNMVSEDSRIFWNAYIAFDGNYDVIPLSYPVSMDANISTNFWKTAHNIYKQQRRWTYGVENVPYILLNFIKKKTIPLGKKIKMSFMQIEGFWSLATNPLLIFLLGWLPLVIGGAEFNQTILSYNLPVVTRNLMLIAMSGLVISSIMSLSFLPPVPEHKKKWYGKFFMVAQWLLIPFTMTFFSAIPGLDAQTRLMFGRYMGFWITPKIYRRNPKSGEGGGD